MARDMACGAPLAVNTLWLLVEGPVHADPAVPKVATAAFHPAA